MRDMEFMSRSDGGEASPDLRLPQAEAKVNNRSLAQQEAFIGMDMNGKMASIGL
jgi:hypothetical protein